MASRLPRTLDERHLGVALSPEMVEERRAGVALRNFFQVEMNKGLYDDDPAFLKAIEEVRLGRHLQDMTQDYYNLVVPKGKKDRATGKLHLQKRDRGHGQGKSEATLRAILGAEGLASSGGSTFKRDMNEVNKMVRFMDKHVMPGSIATMGAEGTSGKGRSKPTDEQLPLRAGALMIDSNNGYDPVTKIPFNGIMQWETTPRDAGHFTAHVADHSLSNDPTNIGWQNGYENKGQSAAEKIAGQEGREATNEEISAMLVKTFINRLTNDVYLPRRNSKEYHAYMAPINTQII